MRTYRLQIRIIQLSVLITVIIMALGVVSVWKGNNSVQSGKQSTSGSTVGNGSSQQNTGTPQAGGGDKPTNTKIVCLGDSFTYGYPGQLKDSWPNRLGSVLKIEVVNAGKTYQNTSDLLSRFDQEVVAQKPGRVVIFAGVGDALRGKSLEEFQKNMQAIVEKAQANQIIPVVALTIPFPGTDQLYKDYLNWETTYAHEKNLMTLDFKTVLFGSDGKMLPKYSDDGRYPNKSGYQAMGDYAAQILK